MDQQQIFEHLLSKKKERSIPEEVPVTYIDYDTNIIWELSENEIDMIGHWRPNTVLRNMTRNQRASLFGRLFRDEIDRRIKRSVEKLMLQLSETGGN